MHQRQAGCLKLEAQGQVLRYGTGPEFYVPEAAAEAILAEDGAEAFVVVRELHSYEYACDGDHEPYHPRPLLREVTGE